MNAHARLGSAEGERLGALRPWLVRRFVALGSHLAVWFRSCVAWYRAATLYEELARLSDAELARRGLSRASLAQNVVQAGDPPGPAS